ncbi:MAG: DUF1592 domain-containing protein [Pirellulaceae bacterium]
MFSHRCALRKQVLQTPLAIRSLAAALGLCAVALITPATTTRAEEAAVETPPRPNLWRSDVQPFLEQYCYDCHSGQDAEANIDFEVYHSADQLANQRPRWEQVRGMIEIGAMPPADHSPLPTIEERTKVARWLGRTINDVDCGGQPDPGRVTMRRLNNVEYDNALRDLLGIGDSPSTQAGFPSDGVGNGFDNQGDVLSLSPLQLEKYLQAAKWVTSQLIIDDPETLRKQRRDLPQLYAGDQDSVHFLFADGTYEVKARLKFDDDKEERKIPVALLVDGEEVERFEVGTSHHTFRLDHEFTGGEHEITLHFVEDPYSEKKRSQRRVDVEYVEIEGPRDAEPALPLAHRRLFTAYPNKEKSLEQAAEEIFRPLLRRAFRRNVEEVEVQRVVNIVKLASELGESYQQAIGFGLQSILVSPHFLFRVEGDDPLRVAHGERVEPSPQPQDQSPSQPPSEPLDDFALASRLSFFLWASIPDDELLDLASQGKLCEPRTLQSQTTRMLADPRSIALVKRFFAQYLGLGNLSVADPDGERFPLWNDRLREDMRRETELFCLELVREDRSLRELLNADFTYVNPRMAELYGIEFDGRSPQELYRDGPGHHRDREKDRSGRYRDDQRWIRVALPAGRRGVLTQAAVLTLTSNPTSTSPVKRGKWILESLLGDPPPPAPPNVPALEATQNEHENLSLRQALELHRANPSCASCHRVMDPLGLGFENFDAIGQWRERDGEHPIDPAGELPDGRKFSNAMELVELLQSRQPEIMRNFANKLVTYAIGRGLEPYDNCAIDTIVAAAEAGDYRLSTFVQAIVTSEPFHHRRPTPPAVASLPQIIHPPSRVQVPSLREGRAIRPGEGPGVSVPPPPLTLLSPSPTGEYLNNPSLTLGRE